MNEPAVLVCALADAEWVVPGSVFDYSCELCGRRVMIAPSGQRLLNQCPGTIVICGPCFDCLDLISGDTMEAVEGAMREMRSKEPNLRRGRN